MPTYKQDLKATTGNAPTKYVDHDNWTTECQTNKLTYATTYAW